MQPLSLLGLGTTMPIWLSLVTHLADDSALNALQHSHQPAQSQTSHSHQEASRMVPV